MTAVARSTSTPRRSRSAPPTLSNGMHAGRGRFSTRSASAPPDWARHTTGPDASVATCTATASTGSQDRLVVAPLDFREDA